MRGLYIVPIFHSIEDMHTLAPAAVKQLKEMGWTEERYNKFLCEFWRRVEWFLREAGLFMGMIASRLHVFLDGLSRDTDSDRIQQIISVLAEDNSPMCSIALELQRLGAQVHGMDDPALIEDLASKVKDPEVDASAVLEVMKKRTQIVVDSVDSGVPEDGIGLVFIGIENRDIINSGKLQTKFNVYKPFWQSENL